MGMNCPFYARAITYQPARIGSAVVGMSDLQLIGNPGSNQCAFVIEAHSPCVMVEPDWQTCPLLADRTVEL